ncbi:MAG: hypothetical protein V1495_02270 [Pseudomonadota bacterium]
MSYATLMPHDKRTRKFIDRWTQALIGGQIVLHGLLLVGLLALFLFADPFVTMFSRYSAEDHVAVAKELIALNASKWPLILLLLFFTGAVSVIFSHQIVGPIVKANSVLARLAGRQLGIRVQFRKTDYFKNLEEHLNLAIDRWRGDLSALAEGQRKTQTLIDELRAHPNSPEKFKELERAVASMAETLRSYEGL